jgi:hypothetical protein
VHKPNGGVSSALNAGVREMRGELFSWLSHDDLYLRDKIESQVRVYSGLNDSRSIVYCDQLRIDSSGALLEDTPACPGVGDSRLLYSILKRRWIGGCTLLIPRRAFDECGVFDESLRTVQDYHLWYRFILGGYRFVHLAHVGVHSRVHQGQDSLRKSDLHLKEKEWLLQWAADNLPPELICQDMRDGRRALLELALSLKKENLRGAYRRFLALATRQARARSVADAFLLLRVLTWSPLWRASRRRLAGLLARRGRLRRPASP